MPRKKNIEFTEDLLKGIERHLAFGCTLEQVSHVIGVCTDYLNKLRKKNKKLDAAIKSGKDKGIALVAGKLFHKATVENNLTAQIFYLKTQAGWREIKFELPEEIKVIAPAGGELHLALDAHEAARMYKKLMEES